MTSSWLKKTLTRLAAPGKPPVPALSDGEVASQIRIIRAHMMAADLEAARSLLDGLWQSNPDNADVLAHLGACVYLAGEREAATPILAKAFAVDPGHAFAAKFLAAALSATREDDAALAVARRAMELNPSDSQVFSVAASMLLRRGQFEETARALNRALEVEPEALKPLEQLEALSVISTVKRSIYEGSPKIAEARRRNINRLLALERKKKLDAESLSALLALLEGGEADSFRMAAKIAHANTDFADMTATLATQLASIFWIEGKSREMLAKRELALKLDAGNRTLALGLAHAQLMLGDDHWKGAWQTMTDVLFHSRADMQPQGARLWRGERLGRETLLVYQDQGIGDAIIALRLLGHLSARKIAWKLWVLPALSDLAAQCVGEEHLLRLPTLPSAKDAGVTFACPLFGLIAALGLAPRDVRAPHPGSGAASRLALAPGDLGALRSPRIGLLLGGNPMRRDDWLRSPSIAATQALTAIGGVSWVNLMIDERPLREHIGKTLAAHDPMPGVKNFADTAALISQLDAVIAIDSSTAHLAAFLGKRLWVLAPSMLDWRWQAGELQSPWWPGARLLRAEAPGEWKQAMATLVTEVREFVKTQAPASP